MNFGDILKQTREESGMNQVELGAKLGISKQTISKYEKGDVLPNAKNLYDIADVLNCSVDWLLGRVDKNENNASYIISIKCSGGKCPDRVKELEKVCVELLLENRRLQDQLNKK